MGRVSLRVRTYSRSYRTVSLIECPACGYPFSEKENRWKHLLENHSPEDFGLSPLGDRRDDTTEVLAD